MKNTTLAGSANLHLNLGAFGVLATSFNPIAAFVLSIVTSYVLAKL